MSSLPSRLAAAAFVLLACNAFAGSTTALNVSLDVPARASVDIRSAPAGLRVTADDVARGWVDADVPLALDVRSNSLRGVLLVFTGASEFVQQTAVAGLPVPLQLSAAGGSVHLPAQASVRDPNRLSLRFRFFLARGTPPGLHAWPLQVAAEPA